MTFEFWLYGVELHPEGRYKAAEFVAPMQNEGIPVRMFPQMPYARFLKCLEPVAVGLSPACNQDPFSAGKSFGKVLAYLYSDVAVVASKTAEHPAFFRHGVNGMLANRSEDWAECVVQLLADRKGRQSMCDHAFNDFQLQLSSDVAAQKVDKILRDAIPQ